MSKPPLQHQPGVCHHVMHRGNRKGLIFHDVDDRRVLEKHVQRALEKHGAKCHAYCWMSNHVHLLIQVGNAPLDKVAHHYASCYAHEFNRKHDLVGHLFEGRYERKLIDSDDYLFTVAKYIHLNPVKDHIVESPGSYEWSSFGSYFFNKPCSFLTTDYLLSYFPANPLEARREFLHMHDVSSDELCLGDWDEADADDDDEMVIAPDQGSFESLLSETLARFDVTLDELASTSRRPALVAARGWMARQVQLKGCASMSQVARLLNRSPQGLGKLARKFP